MVVHPPAATAAIRPTAPPRKSLRAMLSMSAPLQTVQERDQLRVHRLRPLLLGPVTATGKDDRFLEIRHRLSQMISRRFPPDEDEVSIPGDIERRLPDPSVRVRGHELPGAIEGAVPVESPGESGRARTRAHRSPRRLRSATAAGGLDPSSGRGTWPSAAWANGRAPHR